MKGVEIALIVVLGVIAIGLCVLLGMSLGGGGASGRGQGIGSYQICLEQEISPEGLSAIEIDYDKNSNDVRICEGSGDKILIREYANFEVSDAEMTTVQVSEGTLRVEGRRRNSIGGHFLFIGDAGRFGYAEIYLPKEYSEALSVSTSSGNIDIELDLNLNGSVQLAATSGDVTTEQIIAEQIAVATTSGNQQFVSLQSSEVKLASTSGNIRAEELAGYATIAATSGEVTVKSGVKGGAIATTSGDVEVSLSELAADLAIGSTSGEVTVEIPADSSFAFEAECTSGDIETFFDENLRFSERKNSAEGIVNGNTDGKTIKIETTSGDITVLEK